MFTSNLYKELKLLVGITGGIAAYKVPEYIRFFIKAGASVRAMITEAGKQFVTPVTLETLTGFPVEQELFPRSASFSGTHHISSADWATVAAVVPATANILAKYSQGLADDVVSTTLLAIPPEKVMMAPAMNVHMWQNPAVQHNVNRLKGYGVEICPPEYGFLAEGYEGMGRLANLNFLVQATYRTMHPFRNSLKGKTVLITAGRTEEPLDPVRMLTNRSSGKMGFALAWEAFARGAEVILIHGPTDLPVPYDVVGIGVRTAEEMFHKVEEYFPQADIFISAAAVADFKPVQQATSKIKKKGKELTLKLEPTPDILKIMGQRKKAGQFIVGFAVETDHVERNARKKLQDKNLDLIVANNPLESGAAFGVETNRVTIITPAGETHKLELMPKLDVAREIFNVLTRLSDK
ncbi:MAG TPA: bifunctional phosphopantothenoylcysteine decarboxylase/phosphopantothenate--cysteine ligase CoaBC [Calditrichae bacterium]|nr:bifunctional phosphopantothenoylcysteine decarboxylase/phosphopantothenate--cysteine ligase CoaBC [Calditrichia bacterium]